MGALSGSLSVAKFWVRGELPKDPRRTFTDRVKLRRFRPLNPDEDTEERYGWCVIARPSDLELAPSKVFQNEYLTLGFRWDRYRFPPSLVNAHLEEALQQSLSRAGQQRLSRSAKAELKQQVLLKLKRKYFPSLRMVDVVWNLDRKSLYFWSHSSSLQERFRALFEMTFGLELDLNSPYVAAERLLPGRQDLQRLQQLEPEAYHGPG